MSAKDANITIPIDLTNPCQFFVCCGRFERRRYDQAMFCCSASMQFPTQPLIAASSQCARLAVDPIHPIRGSIGKRTNDAARNLPRFAQLPFAMNHAHYVHLPTLQ